MRKVVLTYGTFDLLHVGHVRLFERLAAMGDYLIVGVSTDAFNTEKGKNAFLGYEHRAEVVAAIKGVDLVIPEASWDQKAHDVTKYNVDIFAIGEDWKNRFDYLQRYCDVIYLPRTDHVSSGRIREEILSLNVTRSAVSK